MEKLVTISGVAGYIDEKGTAFLKLKDVARGLGFTQRKGASEYVRYERVNGYLSDMGFPHLLGKEYIPENVFYRLAMKGETLAAQQFQSRVADEILPAIRKHGAYMTSQVIERTLTDPDFIIQIATQLKSEKAARLAAEQMIADQQPLVSFAQTCAASQDTILVREMAKLVNKLPSVEIGETQRPQGQNL